MPNLIPPFDHNPNAVPPLTSQMDFLQAQLIEVQRLLTMVSGHPVMSRSLRCKEDELNRKLAAWPANT